MPLNSRVDKMLLFLSMPRPPPPFSSSSPVPIPTSGRRNLVACQEHDHGCSEDETESAVSTKPGASLLVERYQDGTAKRYFLSDNESKLHAVPEGHGFFAKAAMAALPQHSPRLAWLPSTIKNFALPAGFPESVSDDYLDYMLLQFPTNVTGWVCHTLVTSSLLKAVGVGSFAGAGAAASAAAIKWVLKDGLGAVGRLFIGGRFGNLFDDDPKQWRMYADFIGSAGSIFELCTQLYPEYFLLLASTGNLTKAVARGLKDPAFRVIQSHFAISSNLGEVVAKEEVWEVTAQLVGLALGILVMDTPGLQTSYSMLALTWLIVRLLHLWLRFQSLSVLKFHTINLKRARILVKSHVLHCKVPGISDCNKEEDILLLGKLLQPQVTFCVSLEKMIGSKSVQMVRALLNLYSKEQYVLFVNKQEPRELQFCVTFKVGATSLSVLRSLWQVYWLHEHRERWLDNMNDIFSWLEESLVIMEDGFVDFLGQLEESGWNNNQINLRVPSMVLLDE
ncbi:Root UVB sensitive family protein [Dioscorea alata]|uniref:Root UVB sensitive family protein n=2 Tax=Dioscorea alata TaxID=55571 RepID=A0ACB7VGM1_DIOAL|nr:Root UVB sensitive family protein [Dioscorea alata]KAH7672940.1 Root UVB sensitive family protein [Dioscorea alata]